LELSALEHDQLPFRPQLIKAQDVQAPIAASNFEVAIIAAGPLIQRLDGLDFTSV
jgi:hypothetical protein